MVRDDTLIFIGLPKNHRPKYCPYISHNVTFGLDVAALYVIVLHVVQILQPKVSAAALNAFPSNGKLGAADELHFVGHGTEASKAKEFVVGVCVGLLLYPVEGLLRIVRIATHDLCKRGKHLQGTLKLLIIHRFTRNANAATAATISQKCPLASLSVHLHTQHAGPMQSHIYACS